MWCVTLLNRKTDSIMKVMVSSHNTEGEAKRLATMKLDPLIWYVLSTEYQDRVLG